MISHSHRAGHQPQHKDLKEQQLGRQQYEQFGFQDQSLVNDEAHSFAHSITIISSRQLPTQCQIILNRWCFPSAPGDKDSSAGSSYKHLDMPGKATGSYGNTCHAALTQNAFRQQPLESPGDSKKDTRALCEKHWTSLSFPHLCAQLLLMQTGCSNSTQAGIKSPICKSPHIQTTVFSCASVLHLCTYG